VSNKLQQSNADESSQLQQLVANNLAGFAVFRSKYVHALKALDDGLQLDALEAFATDMATFTGKTIAKRAPSWHIPPNHPNLLESGIAYLTSSLKDEQVHEIFTPKIAQFILDNQPRDAGLANYVAHKVKNAFLQPDESLLGTKDPKNITHILLSADMHTRQVLNYIKKHPETTSVRDLDKAEQIQERITKVEKELTPRIITEPTIEPKHIDAGLEAVHEYLDKHFARISANPHIPIEEQLLSLNNAVVRIEAMHQKPYTSPEQQADQFISRLHSRGPEIHTDRLIERLRNGDKGNDSGQQSR
jgi:hypothetical protein